MSVDQIARQAGARLRDEVAGTAPAEVETSLRALRDRDHRRARGRLVAGGLAAAATFAAIATGVGLGDRDAPEPAAPASTCSTNDLVQCADDGWVTVAGPTTYGFHRIRGFADELDPTANGEELAVYSETHDAGVTFMVDTTSVDDGVGDDAESLARWVASRPFLRTDLLATNVGGLPAWRVDAELRPGPALDRARSCDGEGAGSPCHALLVVAGAAYGETGPWTGMTSRYVFVDLPDGHNLVAWAWSFDDDPAAMDANDLLIRTVRFDPS